MRRIPRSSRAFVGARRTSRRALLLLAVLLSACGSSTSALPDDAAEDDVDAAGDRHTAADPLPPHLEMSVGPASLLASLAPLLPGPSEIGEGWTESIFPAYELPSSCKPIEPQAFVARNLARVTEESVGQHELSYALIVFASEEEAARRVEWFRSAEAELCDRDFGPIAAEILEEGSAGAFRLDDDGFVSEPMEIRPLGGSAAETVDAAAARQVQVTYLGASSDLEVVGDSHEYQVGRVVVRYERSSPANPGLVVDGDAAVDRLIAAASGLGDDLARDTELDEIGERLRRMVPLDQIPDRYQPLDQAVFGGERGDSCEDPAEGTTELVLDGPGWLARQARAIEQLAVRSHVFTSESEAQDYVDDMRRTGASCVASLEIWPAPTFANQASAAEVVVVDGVEMVKVTATAEQRVADLSVEVEMVVRIARTGPIVVSVVYLGLVGDGEFVEPFLVEAMARLG